MADSADVPPPIVINREFFLDAAPERLWHLISNTDRFNRALGFPAMTVDGVSSDDFAKSVRARVLGLTLSWREPPFEWVEGRFYSFARDFGEGPIERIDGGMDLSPEGRGCRFRIQTNFTPRNAFGEFLVRRLIGRRMVSRAERMVRRLAAALKTDKTEPFPIKRAKTSAAAAILARKAQALRRAPVDAAIAERLVGLIAEGYDDELTRMRPFELADRWGCDRLETLRVFFHGVKAGLLDMNWDVLCPNCSAPKGVVTSLGGLKSRAHCPSCDVEYGVNFDDSVELRYAVNPAVRPVAGGTYCVGNPAQTPFALAQLLVRPGKVRSVELDLAAESYVLRDLKAKRAVRLRPSPDADAAVAVDFSNAQDLGERRFRPGKVRLELAARVKTLARVEKESWKEKGAKASVVTALQEFRDLFSSEVLAPGVEIGVRNVALLFSDLKGSTALYEKMGDATAYAVVRDHFDFLFEIIARRRGAVVKTIGDAVMAVFSSGASALEAALEMQRRVGELNARLAPKPPVVIKLGVHQGPAIAINSNAVVDYFGTTVNVAARVQNESVGGDVVITGALRDDPAAREVLGARPVAQEAFTIGLKGLSERFDLWRLLPGKEPPL